MPADLPISNQDIRTYFGSWSKEVIDDFFANYHKLICGYAEKFNLNPEESAEVASDVFKKIKNRANEFDPEKGDIWDFAYGFVFWTVWEFRKKSLKAARPPQLSTGRPLLATTSISGCGNEKSLEK